MPLKRLLSVVRLTLYFFEVPKKFGMLCLLRSARANAIRASVVGSDMFNGDGLDENSRN